MVAGIRSVLGIFIFIILASLCGETSAIANTYTFDDLKALQKSQSYPEFFQHALDPRPSERNEQWAQLVSEMAEGWAKQLQARPEISQWEFDQIEALALWPSLKDVEFFQKYRASIGVKYLRQCFQKRLAADYDACFSSIYHFWERSQKDQELAQGLLALFIDYQEHYQILASTSESLKKIPQINRWMFTQVLAKGDYSQFYCKSPLVLNAMAEHALALSDSISSKAQLMDQAFTVWGPECLEFTHKEIAQRFATSSSVRSSAYMWLKTFNRLGRDDEWAYSVQYLLEAPVKGAKLNQAWNNVSKLGQDFQLRQRILNSLTKFDPLPDRVFIHSDKKLKDGVIQHLAKNFPEYFNTYARACINFLKGVGNFPEGNPTVNCGHFFEQAKQQSLISEKLYTDFQKAKSFRR